MISKAEEMELVRRAQQGDECAFERIHQEHKRRVYVLCLALTGNGFDAEDLTQETFLLIFRKIGMFRGEARFATWLYRIAVNSALQSLRRKRLCMTSLERTVRSRFHGDASASEESVQSFLPVRDPRLHASAERIALVQAIKQLPSGYRTVFVLHEVHGYEHREIAAMIGTSIGNSKSQLHKARGKLRDALGEEKDFWLSGL